MTGGRPRVAEQPDSPIRYLYYLGPVRSVTVTAPPQPQQPATDDHAPRRTPGRRAPNTVAGLAMLAPPACSQKVDTSSGSASANATARPRQADRGWAMSADTVPATAATSC